MFYTPDSFQEYKKSYDPVATARQLEIPILILQGGRDYQVAMMEFELWKSGLRGGGNITFRSYPRLNHRFLEGKGKSLPAEYRIPGHIPDYVSADIADLVNRTSGDEPNAVRNAIPDPPRPRAIRTAPTTRILTGLEAWSPRP